MSAADSLATTVLELQRKLDAAVLAERERCARIAESYFTTDLRGIAAAIRSGKVFSTGPRTSSDSPAEWPHF